MLLAISYLGPWAIPVTAAIGFGLLVLAVFLLGSARNRRRILSLTARQASYHLLQQLPGDAVKIDVGQRFDYADFDPHDNSLRLGTVTAEAQDAAAVGTVLHETGAAFLQFQRPNLARLRNLSVFGAEYLSFAGVVTATAGWWCRSGMLRSIGWQIFLAAFLMQVLLWPIECLIAARTRRLLVHDDWPTWNDELPETRQAVVRQLFLSSNRNLISAIRSPVLVPWSFLQAVLGRS